MPLNGTERQFFAFVQACFAQKRKMLKNNLKAVCDEETIAAAYEALGKPEKTRAQELTMPEYVRLFNFVRDRGQAKAEALGRGANAGAAPAGDDEAEKVPKPTKKRRETSRKVQRATSRLLRRSREGVRSPYVHDSRYDCCTRNDSRAASLSRPPASPAPAFASAASSPLSARAASAPPGRSRPPRIACPWRGGPFAVALRWIASVMGVFHQTGPPWRRRPRRSEMHPVRTLGVSLAPRDARAHRHAADGRGAEVGVALLDRQERAQVLVPRFAATP